MESFAVRAGGPLSGVVRISGAKNSALKLMAACLLAEGRHTLTNVPAIIDVEIMRRVLSAMGVVSSRSDEHTLVIDVPAELRPEAPYELVELIRASIVVLGPLLARMGRARVSMPGGDDFGHRPIDIHLRGLAELGAVFETSHGYIEGKAPRLEGATVVLELPSHTATDNLMMAAARARGTTVIENAAREPEVCDLAEFLCAMGAKIKGAGTSHLEVTGTDQLCATTHEVIPDRVEAATFLAALGMARGEIFLEGACGDHMSMLLAKLSSMGMAMTCTPGGIEAASGSRLSSVDVATLPYPGVATDYKPFIVTLLSVADGVGIVSENLFSDRFRYVDELRRMGADIRKEGHHAVVRGVPMLSGAPVRAPDIRAGAALVLAGLAADGDTFVSGVEHIDRGYERFAEKLQALGADVKRVDGESYPGLLGMQGTSR